MDIIIQTICYFNYVQKPRETSKRAILNGLRPSWNNFIFYVNKNMYGAYEVT